jgi:predicted kinase
MEIKSFTQQINEGLYDPGIFKAFFLAGGPGSGKTFVASSAFAGSGLKVVNSDIAFEREIKKAGLSMKMPDEEEYFRDILRKRAKGTVLNQLQSYINGRLGLVIDSTGRDYDAIARNHNMLQQIGYDCYMVFVNTSLDVALERQKRRERVVPEYIVKNNWEGVQSNIGKFQRLFGMSNFVVVDNNKSDAELVTTTLNNVSKIVRQLIRKPISSYIAKRWMAGERKAKRRK